MMKKIVFCFHCLILSIGLLSAQTRLSEGSAIIGSGSSNESVELTVLGAQVGLNLKSSGTNQSHLNFYNGGSSFWHLSGPRSFEGNNNFSIFYNDGSQFHRVFSINHSGSIAFNTDPEDGPWRFKYKGGGFKFYKTSNAGENVFAWNGNADVYFRYAGRGSGGRAIVHNANNELYLNYAGDFSGGTKVGPQTRFSNGIDGTSAILNNLAIGSYHSGGYRLSVAGKIRAEEVKVYTGWADFVFHDDYVLRPLADVEQFIKEKGHLPDVPSEAEVLENGIEVGAMNATLLQKIEELTLYVIEQNKKISTLEEKVNQLQK